MSIATALNFSNTTPAAPTGKQLIVPQNDGGAPTCNESFYDPVMVGDTGSGGLAGNVPAPAAGDAAAGKLLCANGAWVRPTGELLTVGTGTTATLSHTPVFIFGIFKNGQRLTSLGSSPDFSRSGTSITFTVAGVPTDVFEAVYLY